MIHKRQIRNIRARDLRAGMRYMELGGAKGYFINEVHVDVKKGEVVIVYKGAYGAPQKETFSSIQRVKVRY